MAASKIGLALWLGLITLLWSLHPLLFSQTRVVLVLMSLTGALALGGWLTSVQPLVVWSGGVGLLNLTLALVLSQQPPNLWLGLSAGITLLALLDGSQRFAYLRHCQVEPGVLAVLLGGFVRISGLSLAVGISLTWVVVNLSDPTPDSSTAGLLTIAGAAMFVGLLGVFLLYTNRWPEGMKNRSSE